MQYTILHIECKQNGIQIRTLENTTFQSHKCKHLLPMQVSQLQYILYVHTALWPTVVKAALRSSRIKLQHHHT